MKNKENAIESQAFLEARAWKKQVSDLILDKGWDEFMRRSSATAKRWERKGLIRTKELGPRP